jgi:signal transduction histidine kinase
MVNYSCPHCNQPVDPKARYCGHCGVDIALAALNAENEVNITDRLPTGLPVAPEILVPRLGDYLVEKGLIQAVELEKALAYQAKQAAAGHPLLLGQALKELGLLDGEALDQAVTVQILHLQSALNQANRQLEQRVQDRTQELRKALYKLAELNQLKANFIANISHELRTPLTHIKGYLDILSDGGLGTLTNGQSDALNVLRRAATRLERLIEDLLHFSLASRGELNLRLAPVELSEGISDVVSGNQAKARAAEVKLDISLGINLQPVKCDEEKILWVVSQLVDNAIKFTPKGGRVLVEAWQEKELLTVAVTDTGIGIPKERLTEIFEPFHQLDSSSSRRFGGTGIGLALSNRILEAHGVSLKVESAAGVGSRFQFSLPMGGAKLEPPRYGAQS